MVITYSDPRFPSLIEAGIKIHTIREDRVGRWKPGTEIHHWMHSPRNPSKFPFEFLHGHHRLISKQQISIVPKLKIITIVNRRLTDAEIDELAYNDGLVNSRGLFKWFTEGFYGYILHWTNKKY